MREMCDREGASLAAVIFPLMSHDLRPGRYPFSGNHEKMGKVFRDERIPVIDLLDAFTGLSPERMQAIPAIDPHPNEIAHRVAAESIFDSLLRLGLVDGNYRPRMQKEHSLPGIWKRHWERIHGPVGPRP